MAKVKNPYLSISATGTLAGILSAHRGADGQKMRSTQIRKFKAGDKKTRSIGTPAQASQRRHMALAHEAWTALSDEERAAWNLKAKGKPTTGHALFCGDWMKTHAVENVTLWDKSATHWDFNATTWTDL